MGKNVALWLFATLLVVADLVVALGVKGNTLSNLLQHRVKYCYRDVRQHFSYLHQHHKIIAK